ncbi:MAG TPA: tRNA lysidine(34) synthetase TilS [Pirellulales bacterium]|jgi:tRNA(Ile)-lysidine synthase
MHPFELRLQNDWPPGDWRDLTVLAGVSGGADSIALLRALVALQNEASQDGVDTSCQQDGPGRSSGAELGARRTVDSVDSPPGRLIAAHFHHGLRGADADADMRFVVQLCERLGVECVVGRAEEQTSTMRQSRASEETSRDARYQFLIATAHQVGARYVAVAHTADDQAETVLHHVVRGAGLAGLAGMPRARELAHGLALARPLLGARRAAARAYLADLGQTFREDSSNRDSVYTRNRLRNELLPALAADYNPQIIDALLRLGALAADAQELIAEQAAELLVRCLSHREPERLIFHAPALAAAPRHLLREALIAAWREQGWPMGAMGHSEWTDLAELATEPTPRKRIFPGEVAAERTADQLVLSKPTNR